VFYRDGKALAYLDRPTVRPHVADVAILGWLQKVFTGVVQQAEVYYRQKRIFDGKFGSKERSSSRTRTSTSSSSGRLASSGTA